VAQIGIARRSWISFNATRSTLDAPVQRVTQADVPMPYNKFFERAAKASPEKVVAAARRVLYLA